MPRYILIDNYNLTFLKAVESLTQAEYWAEILAPTHDYLVTGDANRDFSSYTTLELRMLYYTTTGTQVPEGIAYEKLLKGVADLARGLVIDPTPETALRERLGRPLGAQSAKPAPDTATGRAKAMPRVRSKDLPTPASPRPKPGSATGKVWDIADKLLAEAGSGEITKDLRGAIIEACVTAGINASTATTQFGKWRKSLGK